MSQAADMKHKQQVIKVQLSLLDEITEYINIPKMPLKIMHITTIDLMLCSFLIISKKVYFIKKLSVDMLTFVLPKNLFCEEICV